MVGFVGLVWNRTGFPFVRVRRVHQACYVG